MDFHIDLIGCKDDKDVLLRFGEILQFGGPKRNIPCTPDERGGWGVNWDAFNDCWRDVEVGGIWCESEKITFPLKLHLYHVDAFANTSPKGYASMLKILNIQQSEYAREGKLFELEIHEEVSGA